MTKINDHANQEIKLLRKRITVLEKLNAHYKEMEKKMDEALAYAGNIVETVREPLMVMDGDLRVISANKAFYETFQVHAKETQGQFVYDLGNRQWNIPKLRKLLKEIITKRNTLNNYEMQHRFERIGQKIMLLNARRIPPTPAKPRIILLSIEDITERRRMQKEITVGLEEKVKERTLQLDVINQQLKDKVADLEVFNTVAVGRELKMIKLKNEIRALKAKLSAKTQE